MAPEAHGNNGSGYPVFDNRKYIAPPQPGAPPVPTSPLMSEPSTQSAIIEAMGAAMSRLEGMADSVLRPETETAQSAQVEKRPVDPGGSSMVARALNDRSNELAYLLRRMTRLADRLET